jgi:integrase
MAGLTALQVKNAKPGRHADGRGLYLVVRDSGSRAWVARVQVDGKRRDFGLGSADIVQLGDARVAAAELRRKYKNGELVRDNRKPAPKSDIPDFEGAARACHEAMKAGWRNAKHIDSWIACLENHVFPAFGNKPVDTIDSVMVRDALAPIWLTIPETAQRILQRIGAVLDYAHIKGWCPTEAALRSVRKGLPRQPRLDSHYEAMPFADIPAFLVRLRALGSTAGRDALRFTIYTAVRSGETRFAVWSEFDLDKGIWTIPGIRMKTGKVHAVPLPHCVIALLRERWKLRASDTGFVFSSDGEKPISDMTMTKVLRDMKYPGITVHGFRSAFTDWAAEKTDFPKEVADKALAHQLPDRVEAAYRRTDFFDKRRQLMDAWCTYVEMDYDE